MAYLAFSPDGRSVASVGEDGTARLWDIATGAQIGQPVTAAQHALESVAFSPDGRSLADSGPDGAQLLNVDYLVGDTASRLCGQTGRSFTSAEWAQYVHGPGYRKVCP